MLRSSAASSSPRAPSIKRPSRPRWLLAAGAAAGTALLALLSVQALSIAEAAPPALAAMEPCPPPPMPPTAGCCPPNLPPNCCPDFLPPNHCCGDKYNPSGNPADCCDPDNPAFDLEACLCYRVPQTCGLLLRAERAEGDGPGLTEAASSLAIAT